MNELLTVEELAQVLRVPPSWVYEHKDAIPHVRLGKYLRFRISEIETWLQALGDDGGRA
jgi:excisionase family DNA binding protein